MRYFYPPHKLQPRKYSFLLKRPGASASTKGVFPRLPFRVSQPSHRGTVPRAVPGVGSAPARARRWGHLRGEPAALRAGRSAHLRVFTLPRAASPLPGCLFFWGGGSQRRKNPRRKFRASIVALPLRASSPAFA